MLGLGFADQKLPRSTTSSRDDSPDSVIFTHESTFCIFSSGSGSVVDRCSFGSDVHDHETLISELSKQLEVRDTQHASSCGSDQNPIRASVRKNSNPIKKNMRKDEASGEEEGDEETTENPPKYSLSHGPKECQTRGTRSDTRLKKLERRRPASLDLNNRVYVAVSSPRFVAMKKSSAASHRPGTFPSPGTPSYCHGSSHGMGLQKGWSSERVPLPPNCSRRHANAVLLPFNNGRSLPSKWEDAEKWIFSPVISDRVSPLALIPPQQRRPKSKSGPMGGLGTASYSSPPMIPVFDGERVGNFTGSSPFSTGVLVANALSGRAFRGGAGGAESYPVHTEHCIARSASVHGWSDLPIQSAMPKDGKDGTKDAGTMISPALSRRDMATQMSPVHSSNSSAKERPLSPASSFLPIAEMRSYHPSKLEVKDVQLDDHVTVTKWSKKHRARGLDKCSTNIGEWMKKVIEARTSTWEIAETEKCISKFRRDEVTIMAWENLQKAKAEAEIRKVEMKLEKMRTSSMDKIMNKLRLAQRKAQEMRSSVSASQVHEVPMIAKTAVSFRKVSQMGSLTGCFSCHAF